MRSLSSRAISESPFYLTGLLLSLLIGAGTGLNKYGLIAVIFGALLGMVILIFPSAVVYLLFSLALLNPVNIPTILTLAGHIEIKAHDLLFLLALVIVIFTLIAREKTGLLLMPKAFWSAFIFLFVVALSLTTVAINYPDHLVTSTVSLLKYGEYFMIAFLVAVFFRTKEKLSNGLLVFAATAALLVLLAPVFGVENPASSSYLGSASHLLLGRSARSGSLVGENALGLISGLLICFAMVQFRRKRISPYLSETTLLALGGLGLLGLWFAKSMSASLGLGVALVIELLWRGKENIIRFVISGLLGIALIAAVLVAVFMRGELTGLLTLTGGSWAHRVVLGVSGLLVFVAFPLFGAGWQLSSVVSYEPEILAVLFRLFPKVPYYYFPSLSGGGVHNAYIQVLAELGIVGALAFLYVIVSIIRFGLRVLQTTKGKGALESMAKFSFLGIVYVLVWLNSNGLFGGLPEQALFWFFVGALVAISIMGPGSKNKKSRLDLRWPAERWQAQPDDALTPVNGGGVASGG